MSSAELIARLKARWADGNAKLEDEAADAIEALEAERDALVNSANALDAEATRLSKQITEAKGVAVKVMAERDALRAQLAAAQEQEPVAKCTWGGRIEHLHEGSPSKLVGVMLYAAPIPQQPAQQAQPERAPNLQCNEILRSQGKSYPRTCAVCRLGKCHYQIDTAIKQGGQHD